MSNLRKLVRPNGPSAVALRKVPARPVPVRPVPVRPNGLSAVLNAVAGNLQLRPSDTFKMTVSNGVISIHKRHADGRVESLRLRAGGSFRQTTKFDPSEITIPERRRLEAEMHQSGLSQSEIADLLGVSQATVSLDLRKS